MVLVAFLVFLKNIILSYEVFLKIASDVIVTDGSYYYEVNATINAIVMNLVFSVVGIIIVVDDSKIIDVIIFMVIIAVIILIKVQYQQ